MEPLNDLVVRAQAGDLEAFGRLVWATQTMVFAVAREVLRHSSLAEDAAQEAYFRAFRRLRELDEPAAFISWLRRIVITVALNMRRARRFAFLRLDDIPDIPVLDEAETTWSELQRQRLARALLMLTADERQLCDRRYHGRWSTARLACEAGVDEPAMRKRLQRIREKLRKEIEVSEQRGIHSTDIRPDFPAHVVELLARPRLTDLPESPVGGILEILRTFYADFTEFDLPEIIDLAEARTTFGDNISYLDPLELHHVDGDRVLRYDLCLPSLLTVRYEGRALRIWSAGKAYRPFQVDATRLDAFHQFSTLCIDEQRRLDPWRTTGQILQSMDALLPGRAVRIAPTQYTECSQAFELAVDDHGRWFEVIGWGVLTDNILRHLGCSPDVHTAIGVDYSLERLAMLRYGIDDIRKIEMTTVP